MLKRIYEFLIYSLPAAMYFSYFPILSLGGNETMNFEFSIALIWLVCFDFVSVIILVRKKLWQKLWRRENLKWILLPGFLTISCLWSLNMLRGILTVGILWLVYLAIFSFFNLRTEVIEDGKFCEKLLKNFWAAGTVVILWMVLQCVLDLAGVSREKTLLCMGCGYEMFGFPHPNGFAIEPQFMGNLLIVPAIISTWLFLKDDCNSTFRTRVARSRRHGARALILGRNLRNVLKILLPIVFMAALFLTFSRGAIYAFLVGAIVMMIILVKQKRTRAKRVFVMSLTIVLAFLFTLNLQGVMAEVSRTDDTYFSGVAKVLNQLSLGTIEIRGEREIKEKDRWIEKRESEVKERASEEEGKSKAVFDGYVEESTETRTRLSEAAFSIFRKDFKTAMVGVGLGGAGQALYENGLSPAPKEIIQNQYMSLLVEGGMIGVVLMILTLIMIFKEIWKIGRENFGFYVGVLVSFMVSVMFFAGLPNALHIYLWTGIIISSFKNTRLSF